MTRGLEGHILKLENCRKVLSTCSRTLDLQVFMTTTKLKNSESVRKIYKAEVTLQTLLQKTTVAFSDVDAVHAPYV